MITETTRLQIIPCDESILEAAIQGNQKLENTLQVSVAENWTEFGVEALQYSLDRLKSDKAEYPWWTFFPIHKEDKTLIGSGGYKGQPNEEGIVEIGYEIAPGYRQKGLASEFAKALVENAFQDSRVKTVIAHTLGETNPSTKVLFSCGFIQTDELTDPEVGKIWKWELKRP